MDATSNSALSEVCACAPTKRVTTSMAFPIVLLTRQVYLNWTSSLALTFGVMLDAGPVKRSKPAAKYAVAEPCSARKHRRTLVCYSRNQRDRLTAMCLTY